MCGIVGYLGEKQALPVLLEGLAHLEYRGYDSSGIACLVRPGAALWMVREKGRLAALRARIGHRTVNAQVGIGHTRWATHGEPCRRNAHPQVDASGRVALVHNGIIENHAALKEELKGHGIRFRSETDTEVAANLIGWYARKGSFQKAFVKAVKRLQGNFCLVAMSPQNSEELLVFRRANPICIGLGKGENFIASDVTPILAHTKKVLYLEDNEYALVSRDRVRVFRLSTGGEVRRRPVMIRWDIQEARKGGYSHFMMKEMLEQPRILKALTAKCLGSGDRIVLETISGSARKRLAAANRIFVVSCGTAYHAGLAAVRMFEELLRIPSQAQVSSEFRYSDRVVHRGDLVILVTQSGETADTLAALHEARRKGAFTLAVVNVVGSTIAREADAVIYTHAGPEIGVASTKAFTAQLMTLSFLALFMARLRGSLKPAALRHLTGELRKIPSACEKVLRQHRLVRQIARRHFRRRNFLYLGRGYNFPTALEGALKLKEISYAHAHGYAAGEMKHGPIALIDREQLVICLAPQSATHEKMLSNIEEIRAREGMVITIGTEGDPELKRLSQAFWTIPKIEEMFSPVLTTLPLQLFAYEIAVLNGRDVDKPRNLAKSVTVE